jgi:hypothetical protein
MKKLLLAVILLMALSSIGNATLIISADSTDPNWLEPVTSGNQNSQNEINGKIAPYIHTDIELYKNTAEGNIDEGAFAGSYNTTYSYDSDSKTNNAIISWVPGTSFITGGYLLAKDGNSEPNWYLYDLNGLWNGKETIELEDFFYKHSFSHVTIYGDPTHSDPVPEPATMLLFGTGIVGLVGVIRKKRS